MMNSNRIVGRAAAAMALVTMAMGTAASAKVQLSLETQYRLGYDANPFLSAGADTSATYMETSISPRISVQSPKGETSLSGYFDRTAYFSKYGRSDEYGAAFDTRQRLTNSLSVFGKLGYDSQVIGQGDDEVTGNPTDGTDVNLIGLRQRADTYSSAAGFEYQISPKDSLTANGGYTATRYRGGVGAGADSNTYGGQVGWQHALNAKSKIGIRGSVYQIDYDTAGLNTLIMQPQVTFTSALSPTWTIDASAGISFSKLESPPIGAAPAFTLRTKGFAGSLQLCHVGARDNFCLFADRSVSASGAGSTVERSQLGINYRRKLDERLALHWTGNYSRSEGLKNLLGTREYVSGRGGLEYEAWRGIKFGVEGKYRDFFGGVSPVRADYGGDVYATINLATR